jgi:uncharacterized DUF497 family protein
LVIVEWDGEKSAANEKKHGVSFSEAVSALEARSRSRFGTQITPSTSFDSSPSGTTHLGVS